MMMQQRWQRVSSKMQMMRRRKALSHCGDAWFVHAAGYEKPQVPSMHLQGLSNQQALSPAFPDTHLVHAACPHLLEPLAFEKKVV